MKLPELTVLQFYVLDSIGTGVRSASQIMQALKECGEERDPSAFYQLMARMMKAKLVTGRIRSKVFDRRHYRERFYLISKTGVKRYNEAVEFYAGKQKI